METGWSCEIIRVSSPITDVYRGRRCFLFRGETSSRGNFLIPRETIPQPMNHPDRGNILLGDFDLPHCIRFLCHTTRWSSGHHAERTIHEHWEAWYTHLLSKGRDIRPTLNWCMPLSKPTRLRHYNKGHVKFNQSLKAQNQTNTYWQDMDHPPNNKNLAQFQLSIAHSHPKSCHWSIHKLSLDDDCRVEKNVATKYEQLKGRLPRR